MPHNVMRWILGASRVSMFCRCPTRRQVPSSCVKMAVASYTGQGRPSRVVDDSFDNLFLANKDSMRSQDKESLRASWEAKRKVKDLIYTGFGGDIRVAVVRTTQAAEEARRRWNLTHPGKTKLLSDVLSSAVLLNAFMKGEERIEMVVTSESGLVESVMAQSIRAGEVRASITEREGRFPPSTPLMGEGVMAVKKIIYGKTAPFESFTPFDGYRSSLGAADEKMKKRGGRKRKDNDVRNNEADAPATMTEAVQGYLLSSQQSPSFFVEVDSVVNPDTSAVEFAGAILVESMPPPSREFGAKRNQKEDRSMEKEDKTETREVSALEYGRLHGQGHSLQSLFENRLLNEGLSMLFSEAGIEDVEIKEGTSGPVHFFCRCSKDKLASAILALSVEELQSYAKSEASSINITCQFCNERYQITGEDLVEAAQKEPTNNKQGRT